MIAVRFVGADGAVVEAFGAHGARLLDVAQACGQPLEGTCDGQMACSTCHVIVDPVDFARTGAPGEDEDALLDLAPAATRTSRLACQIILAPALAGLRVRIPIPAR